MTINCEWAEETATSVSYLTLDWARCYVVGVLLDIESEIVLTPVALVSEGRSPSFFLSCFLYYFVVWVLVNSIL